MNTHEFDVTPLIKGEDIAKAMEPFNEALQRANALTAHSPHLHWTYTIEPDPLSMTRYVLKVVGTPKMEGGA